MHIYRSISYLSSLLDKEDRAVRIAAGEALALVFEMGVLEKFSAEAKGLTDGSVLEGSKLRDWYVHIQGLKGKILNQVKSLSVEAGGKGSAKKDLNFQRNTFRDILEFLEVHYIFIASINLLIFGSFLFLGLFDYRFCKFRMAIVLKLQLRLEEICCRLQRGPN